MRVEPVRVVTIELREVTIELREVTIELREVARVCVVSPDCCSHPLVVDRPLREPSVVFDNLGK